MKKTTLLKDLNRVSVWLDLSGACLYRPGRPPVGLRTIASGVESQVRIPGETPDGVRLGGYRHTNNEAHRNNRRRDQLQQYYKKVAGALKRYDVITITGRSTTGRAFYHFLAEQKNFADKKLFMRPASARPPVKMTLPAG
jgi:hypothetical protein